MISETYIQRPAVTLTVQLTEADEAEIKTAFTNPNLTVTRDGNGHWTFTTETGPDHEADDGDWVAYMGYWVGPAIMRADPGCQRVSSADVVYVVDTP